MDFVKLFIPFIEQYPYWMRVTLGVWLLAGGIVACLFIVINRIPSHDETVSSSTEGDIHVQRTYESHYDAISGGVKYLKCRSGAILLSSGLSTPESRACFALTELRNNLFLIYQYRKIMNENSTNIPTTQLEWAQSRIFFGSDFEEVPYGIRTEDIFDTLDRLEEAGQKLGAIRTKEELDAWGIQTQFTIDDLFAITGFIEWVIAWELKNLTPQTIILLGPFYDVAYTKNECKDASFRFLKDIFIKGFVEKIAYVDLVSEFD